MIVKVQISMVPRNSNVMVYNESETFICQFPADKDVLEKADGRFKFFCKAEIVSKELVLGEEVEDQGW